MLALWNPFTKKQYETHMSYNVSIEDLCLEGETRLIIFHSFHLRLGKTQLGGLVSFTLHHLCPLTTLGSWNVGVIN